MFVRFVKQSASIWKWGFSNTKLVNSNLIRKQGQNQMPLSILTGLKLCPRYNFSTLKYPQNSSKEIKQEKLVSYTLIQEQIIKLLKVYCELINKGKSINTEQMKQMQKIKQFLIQRIKQQNNSFSSRRFWRQLFNNNLQILTSNSFNQDLIQSGINFYGNKTQIENLKAINDSRSFSQIELLKSTFKKRKSKTAKYLINLAQIKQANEFNAMINWVHRRNKRR